MTARLKQPRVEMRVPFTVAGVRARGTAEGIDFTGLWADLGTQCAGTDLAAASEGFGVEYEFDEETGEFTYLAGVAVTDGAAVPEGLVRVHVPGGTYAVFEANLDTIGETIDAVYGEWLPESEYERGDGPEFEYYPERFDAAADPALEVWVPIAET